MRITKTPDLSSWKKLGDMKTKLGKTFALYESPDGKKVAQVDEGMMIHMIIEDGKPVYLNPTTMDGLKRMKEIQKEMRKISKAKYGGLGDFGRFLLLERLIPVLEERLGLARGAGAPKGLEVSQPGKAASG